MKKSTSAAALALHSALAGLGLLTPLSLYAQTTVTYTDTQVSTTNRATTSANPLTFTIASGTATENGVVSGDGSLTKTGDGTLRLGTTNTYSGGTFLSAGTLDLSADNALGTGAITTTGGGLRAGGAPRTLSNALFTSGNLTVGRLTTFAGATTLNANTTFIASNPDGPANGDTTFSGAIGGNFGVTLAEGAGGLGIGSGYIGFSGANTYTGGTTLRTRLSINSDSGLGAASGSLTMDGGTLRQMNSISSARDIVLGAGGGTFEVNGFSSFSGEVSGSGGITQAGGFLGFLGPITYTGPTTIRNGGVIKFGNSGPGFSTVQTSGITIESGGLYFGDDVIYAGPISGAGHLKHEFAGTTVLTGIVAHTGGTQINAGAIQIGDGGTTGSLSGDVALSSGGNLAFKRSDAVALAGVVSGDGTLTQLGAGTLTLSGTNTFTGGTTVNAGLIAFSALANFGTGNVTLNGGGLRWAAGSTTDISSRLNALGASGATFDTNGNNVTLASVLSGTGALTKSGAGTLTLTNTNTYAGGTTITGGLVKFSTGANLGTGTLTLNGGGLQWATGASTDVSSRLAPLGAGGATFDTNGNNVTLASVLSGAGALTKSGAGTLTLTNANTFGGGATISGGALQIGNGGSTGLLSGNVVNDGSLVFNRFNLATYSGVISGSGAVTQDGTGVMTLLGEHTYTGGTTISRGSIQIGQGGTTGSFVGAVVNNGNLRFNRSDTWNHSGAISGSGNVAKSGNGTLTLTAANSYTGGTSIEGGQIILGNASALGTGSVSLVFTATLDASTYGFDLLRLGGSGTITSSGDYTASPSSDFTLATAMAGVAALTKTGAATLTLTGSSTHAGGTTISAGTLRIGGGGTVGSLAGNIVNNAALVFNRSNSLTHAGAISGTGTLTNSGAGTLVLTGAATHTGGTTISAGRIQIGSNTTTGSLAGDVAVGAGAILAFSRSDAVTHAGIVSGAGSLLQLRGLLTLGGNNTYAGGTTISGGLVNFSSLANLGTGNITLNGGGLQWATGTTTDVSPRLNALGASGATFDTNGNNVTLASALSGTGALTKAGAGTLTLSGANTYAGATTITGGQITMGHAAAVGMGSVGVASGAMLDAAGYGFDLNRLSGAGAITSSGAYTASPASNVTLATSLAGTASLTKTGAGTLTLSGTNTYTGGTTITGGLVGFTSVANLGTGNIILDGGGLLWPSRTFIDISPRLDPIGAGGATFAFDGAYNNSATFSTALTGSGGITKAGIGILYLAAANTYLGTTTIRDGEVGVRNNGVTTFGTLGSGLTSVGEGRYASLQFYDAASAGNGAFIANVGASIYFNGTSTASHGTFTMAGGTVGDVYGADLGIQQQATAGYAIITLNGATAAGAFGSNLYVTDTADLGAATITVNGGTNGGLGGGITFYNDATGGTATVKLHGNGFLDLTSSIHSSGDLSPDSANNVGIGSLEGDGRVLLGGGLTVGANNASTGFSGVIEDGYSFYVYTRDNSFTKVGTGALTLSGANTYSGGTTVNAGTLVAGHVSAFGSAAVRVNAGTLDLGGLAIANSLDVRGGSLAGLAAYSGTQTVSGSANYTGTVAGTLLVAGGGTVNTTGATFTGPATVQDGGTLTGTGTVASLTVQSGGTLAPGNSPGTLTFTGGLSLSAGTILDFELGSASDLIVVSGGTLSGPSSGSITINLTDSGGFGAGTYTLIDATGATLSSIGATSFALGTTIAGYTYTFGQNGDLFQLVATSAIPEPAAWTALAGLVSLAFASRRKRRA